jgi:hypothetical protein
MLSVVAMVTTSYLSMNGIYILYIKTATSAIPESQK